MKRRFVEKKAKKNSCSYVLVFFVLILAVFVHAIPVFAESENQTENPLILKQKDSFPNLSNESELTKLLSSLGVSNPEKNESYKYVDADGNEIHPTSEKVGFQKVYIEPTKNKDQNKRIAVPVTITDKNTTLLSDNQMALQLDGEKGQLILYPDETANKSREELQQLVKEKTNARAWKTNDGTEVQVDVSNTTISNSVTGKYSAEFQLVVNSQAIKTVKKEVIVFGATPKKFVLLAQGQDVSSEKELKKLFSSVQTLKSLKESDLQYQMVDENGNEAKMDTSTTGFQWMHVKVSEKENQAISTSIKVPVTVVAEKAIEEMKQRKADQAYSPEYDNLTLILDSKAGLSMKETPIIYTSEINGKSNEEIIQLLTDKLQLNAWKLSSGEKLTPTISTLTTNPQNSFDMRFMVEIPFNSEIVKCSINAYLMSDDESTLDNVGSRAGWTTIPLNDSAALTSSTKSTLASFPLRGLKQNPFYSNGANPDLERNLKNERGYLIQTFNKDDSFTNSTYASYASVETVKTRRTKMVNDQIFNIPAINGRPIYLRQDIINQTINTGSTYRWDPFWSIENMQANGNTILTNISFEKYVESGEVTQLRQVIRDSTNRVTYTYLLQNTRNGNIQVNLSMQNDSNVARDFSMLQGAAMGAKYSAIVPIKASPNGEGFYANYKIDLGSYKKDMQFTMKYKKNSGALLGELDRYWAEPYTYSTANNDRIYTTQGLNPFGDNFEKSGMEETVESGQLLVPGWDAYPIFLAGAPPRKISSGESMHVVFETFFGEEVPYMDLSVTPKEYNMYQDQNVLFPFNYTLKSIPSDGGVGKIYLEYPDKSQGEFDYTGNASNIATGQIAIPPSTLPAERNPDPGSVKSYTATMTAVDTKSKTVQNLPSNELALQLNVYNFGADVKGYAIPIGGKITHSAADMIKKVYILPGHISGYQFVDDITKLDTSKEGIKFVRIKVWDKTDSRYSAIVDAPVYVYGDPGTKDPVLKIFAQDFESEASEFTGLNNQAVNKKIIYNSAAKAFGLNPFTEEGITLSVESTNLEAKNGDYTATLIAKKAGYEDVRKVVNIKLAPPAPKLVKTTIGFYDEENKSIGNEISTSNSPGSTINLNELAKATVDKIEGQGYELAGVYGVYLSTVSEKVISNPTTFEISSDVPVVKYKFKKAAPKQQDTTIGFYDESGEEISGFPAIKSTNSEGTIIDLNAVTRTQVDQIKEQGYELEGVYGFYKSIVGEKQITDPTTFKVTSDVPLVKYKFKKAAAKQIDTNIGFYDESGEESSGFPAIKSTNSEGSTINLNELAAETVEKIKEQGYELEGVYGFYKSIVGEKQITDPTTFKVTSDVPLVKYKFKKAAAKQIDTNIGFYDESGEEISGFPAIKSTNSEGSTINLNELATETVEKIKGKGYDLIGVYGFYKSIVGEKQITDPTTFKVTSDVPLVKYKFKKAAPPELNTLIQFWDESDKEMPDFPAITSTNSEGSTINLNELAKATVNKIKEQGYELEGVYGFYKSIVGEKQIADPTMFKVTSDVPLVKYKFAKKIIKTSVVFYDQQSNSEIKNTTIQFSGVLGDKVNLLDVREIKAKLNELTDYKSVPVKAVDLVTGQPIDDMKNYVIGSGTNAIKLFLEKNTQKLTVSFKDTDGEDLIPAVKPVVIEEVIGTEVELSKNKQVTKVIEDIKAQHYQMIDQPADKIKITEKEQTVVYKFDGTLFIESAPSKMTFGKQKIKKGFFFIKVEKASFDTPLTIWDNRKKSKNWQVTATLKTPFTSVVDETQTLPADVLRYKKDDNKTVPLRKDVAEVLAQRTSEGVKNEYTLSDDWKSGKTGFQMEIPTKKIEVMGGYRAEILWQVGVTP